jgi:hypothetical protein
LRSRPGAERDRPWPGGPACRALVERVRTASQLHHRPARSLFRRSPLAGPWQRAMFALVRCAAPASSRVHRLGEMLHDGRSSGCALTPRSRTEMAPHDTHGSGWSTRWGREDRPRRLDRGGTRLGRLRLGVGVVQVGGVTAVLSNLGERRPGPAVGRLQSCCNFKCVPKEPAADCPGMRRGCRRWPGHRIDDVVSLGRPCHLDAQPACDRAPRCGGRGGAGAHVGRHDQPVCRTSGLSTGDRDPKSRSPLDVNGQLVLPLAGQEFPAGGRVLPDSGQIAPRRLQNSAIGYDQRCRHARGGLPVRRHDSIPADGRRRALGAEVLSFAPTLWPVGRRGEQRGYR